MTTNRSGIDDGCCKHGTAMTGAPQSGITDMTGRYWKLTACCIVGLAAMLHAAAAETSTSGWVQRTKPTAITRPAKRKRSVTRRPKAAPRRTKSKVIKPTTTTKPLGAPNVLPKSTLGPIMAEPSGEDAAYIAFDQGQYLTALHLAKAAAERNEPQALTLMGRIYESGLGVPVDALKAARLYRRGAELGDTEAMFAFAVMLAAGRGIQKNFDGAANLFERAARSGHPEANYNLGLLFIAGTGKPENPRRALMHIQYAAQKGLAAAQYDLAALYRKGHGTDADAYQATRWLRAAAKSGMAAAQYEYAVSLLQGRGFNRDKPDILDYLIDASRQGVPGAQNRLAHIYAEGRLVRKNMTEAAKWRLIAKATGRKSEAFDKALDQQIANMARNDLRQAQDAANRFIEGSRVGDTIAAAQR